MKRSLLLTCLIGLVVALVGIWTVRAISPVASQVQVEVVSRSIKLNTPAQRSLTIEPGDSVTFDIELENLLNTGIPYKFYGSAQPGFSVTLPNGLYEFTLPPKGIMLHKWTVYAEPTVATGTVVVFTIVVDDP